MPRSWPSGQTVTQENSVAAQDRSVLRLLSYNIWNYAGSWNRRKVLLANLIADLDPDVVALQEVRHSWRDLPGGNQAQWLAHELGYFFYFRPANMYFPVPLVVEGLAFLSKRPCDGLVLHPIPNFPGAGPPRVILHGRWGTRDVFNVHFPLREKARNLAARVLLSACETAGAQHGVAVGDFNTRVSEEPMNKLFADGFVDLWPALSPEVPWPTADRIDYMLGYGNRPWSGSIMAVGTAPDEQGTYPSDHFGILADLHP
jgi:endonuclease/exonuclease/phosphatase family metal-dependent hydrolase